MKSDILENEEKRNLNFLPNRKLELLIKELSSLLAPAQDEVNNKFLAPKEPIIAIIGCPRSGTTFMTQLLASTGAVSYPSNLLSRFAYAPYIGALIQQMLLNPEYDLGQEFSDLLTHSNFSSNIGKTSGALGISEFFHFWRKFLPNHDPGYIELSNLENVDIKGMKKELESIEAVFKKPLVSKAMMLQYNLDFFAKNIPEMKFIYIKREPLYLMQSIKQARIKYYGDENIWWSVKPEEYSFLKNSSPDHQVAGQVVFTDLAIKKHSKNIAKDRFFEVNYEDVCANPKRILREIAEQFKMGNLVEDLSGVTDEYISGNSVRLSEKEINNLLSCYKELSDL